MWYHSILGGLRPPRPHKSDKKSSGQQVLPGAICPCQCKELSCNRNMQPWGNVRNLFELPDWPWGQSKCVFFKIWLQAL